MNVGALVRDAAAPLLLLGALSVLGLVSLDVWAAAGLATLVVAGRWQPPPFEFGLSLRLVLDGFPALVPSESTVWFTVLLGVILALEIVAVASVSTFVIVVVNRRGRSGDPRRALLRRRDLGDLAGAKAVARARHLRPSLVSTDDPLTGAQLGIRVLRIDGHDIRMSWEDVALVVMGPRSNKTSALAVPAVLSAPGLAVATSNKADLWALTSGLRGRLGPVWTFDPQQIAHVEQTWWWDPLRSIREAPSAHRYEAASRLAGHFMGTIGGTRKDPFFHAAGEQVLIGTLLAAALSDGTVRDVLAWLQFGRREAVIALDHVGAGVEAADLEASLGGADVTTKGIFQTARTATKALASEATLRWITPPATWRQPPRDPERFAELDPWDVIATAASTPATAHLLSKEGAGTAAPIVAALVDRILEVAELSAQARGGRLDPPLVAVLDEAANICPIRTLPQLYSHFGSRGIQVMTMLQSYQQGVGVWGAQGMDALWSAATIKLVGAGVDDHEFLRRISGLVGDHDVEKVSTSHDRQRGPSRQYSTAREPVLPVSVLRALPRSQAVLFSTGRKAGLGDLLPWYQEHDAADIASYSDTALTELRLAASEAMSPLAVLDASIDDLETQ